MKRQIFGGIVFVFFLTAIGSGVPKTEIWYQTIDLGLGRWQYTYDVTNISLTMPIEEFTIWFDFGLYKNLVVENTGNGCRSDRSYLVFELMAELSGRSIIVGHKEPFYCERKR